MDAVRKRRLTWLQKHLEYNFKRLDLLQSALTHRSFVNEPEAEGAEHNERLEFLGDAVIELVITDMLYKSCADQPEGPLSKMRARVVNGRSLAAAALNLGLDRYVQLSRGEQTTGGRRKDSILAGCYEALIGALYLDGGMRQARRRLVADLQPTVRELLAGSDLYRDYKTRLQEVSQQRFGSIPVYTVVEQSGPDHAKVFTVQVTINGQRYGRANGPSKKEAQQRSAKQALNTIGDEQETGCDS
ncbi:MAG: ribonuclease III [Candidatus Alcyoniella australis]|nr:ribonuclease III [Candidatus Alcyoniella australis]